MEAPRTSRQERQEVEDRYVEQELTDRKNKEREVNEWKDQVLYNQYRDFTRVGT